MLQDQQSFIDPVSNRARGVVQEHAIRNRDVNEMKRRLTESQ